MMIIKYHTKDLQNIEKGMNKKKEGQKETPICLKEPSYKIK